MFIYVNFCCTYRCRSIIEWNTKFAQVWISVIKHRPSEKLWTLMIGSFRQSPDLDVPLIWWALAPRDGLEAETRMGKWQLKMLKRRLQSSWALTGELTKFSGRRQSRWIIPIGCNRRFPQSYVQRFFFSRQNSEQQKLGSMVPSLVSFRVSHIGTLKHPILSSYSNWCHLPHYCANPPVLVLVLNPLCPSYPTPLSLPPTLLLIPKRGEQTQ